MFNSISFSGQKDFLGNFIKKTPYFRGKSRLTNYWMKTRSSVDERIRHLPGGGRVLCNLSIPYEAMTWLEREEQEDLELLCTLLEPGQTFVDCGTNIGLWTLVATAKVGQEGRVFSFEPNPKTFRKLQYNIELTSEILGFQNIEPTCQAVGKESSKMLFQCSHQHNVSQLLVNSTSSGIDSDEMLTVPVIDLDSYLDGQKINFIKIDVEGYELAVLQGSKAILEEQHPLLCVEFNTIASGASSLKLWPVHEYLSSLGYICCQFQDALKLMDGSVNALPDSWGMQGYCNLFYIHRLSVM